MNQIITIRITKIIIIMYFSLYVCCFLFMFFLLFFSLCFSFRFFSLFVIVFMYDVHKRKSKDIFIFFVYFLLDNDLCFWGSKNVQKIVPSMASFIMISIILFFCVLCVFLQFLLADKSLENLIIYGQTLLSL